jgi:hypothetical protein
MEHYDAGTLLVNDRGQLVMLTADGIQTGELQPSGVVPQYYEGTVLPNIARWRGTIVRKVGHISDLVSVFAQTVDIKTPATKDESELTEREMLAKVLRDNAALKQEVANLSGPSK